MGLPVRQRRVLGRIESALRGSDPKLAALYTIFARLTRDEEMPRAEQLRHRAILVLAWLVRLPGAIGARLHIRPRAGLGRRPGAIGASRHIRPRPRQRAVLFFPLAIALAVTSIVFAARASSGNCTPVKSVAATKTVAKPTKLCTVPGLTGIGH